MAGAEVFFNTNQALRSVESLISTLASFRKDEVDFYT